MYDFDDYLEKYAKKHEISKEEAKEHKMVKVVEELAKNTDSEMKEVGCHE